MHRQLRVALQDAEGFSDLVIVIFLDVRGFSSFAGMAESSEAAILLRRMYLAIVDDYFPESSFFKPTGDGLMIVRHFDRESLRSEVEDAVTKSLQLVADFPHISDSDPMVNFEVPASLGVGIARGAATRLASGDLTIDYSGRPLNLAARLMDLARPRGVVFDNRLVKGLELDALLEDFESSSVYLKGIADTLSMDVYASKGVSIPPGNRRPMEGVPYETPQVEIKFKDLVGRGLFIHKPPVEPVDADDIELVISSPVPTPSGSKGTLSTVRSIKPQSTRRGSTGWEAIFDYTNAVDEIADEGVKNTWTCTLQLRYMATELPKRNLQIVDGKFDGSHEQDGAEDF